VKILLVGAAGQLGRALLPALADHEVVGLDRAGLDIVDLAAVRAMVGAHRPAAVVNAAAYTLVDRAESEPDAAFRCNATGPRNLALAAAEAGAALLQVSTDYVFDGEASRPYHEFDATNPLSVYGRSKLAGEMAVRELNPRHFVVRTAWLYAPAGRNFAASVRSQAAQGQQPVRVVTDQVGSPTFAPHLAAAIAQLLPTGAFGTYHLAGAGATSWHGFTLELLARLGIATAVEPTTSDRFPRPARRPRYAPLASLQEPRILLPPWEDGVAEYAALVRG
jgi:dTDP-4-dehydrorhamnose reductase